MAVVAEARTARNTFNSATNSRISFLIRGVELSGLGRQVANITLLTDHESEHDER